MAQKKLQKAKTDSLAFSSTADTAAAQDATQKARAAQLQQQQARTNSILAQMLNATKAASIIQNTVVVQ